MITPLEWELGQLAGKGWQEDLTKEYYSIRYLLFPVEKNTLLQAPGDYSLSHQSLMV
jgi:hypothetical protein